MVAKIASKSKSAAGETAKRVSTKKVKRDVRSYTKTAYTELKSRMETPTKPSRAFIAQANALLLTIIDKVADAANKNAKRSGNKTISDEHVLNAFRTELGCSSNDSYASLEAHTRKMVGLKCTTTPRSSRK